MNRERGFTIVDSLILIAIAIMAVIDGLRAYDAMQVHTRLDCFVNQQALDQALWAANAENKREPGDVVGAYAVAYPDDRPAKLVVLYRPGAGHAYREIAVYDLSKQKEPVRAVCPLHVETRARATIDYWYALGRWHCFHNKWHSA